MVALLTPFGMTMMAAIGHGRYPVKSLVSYQTYRQLSGWILPPLVKRAVGAHRIIRVKRWALLSEANMICYDQI